jgi:hypothetical protein
MLTRWPAVLAAIVARDRAIARDQFGS